MGAIPNRSQKHRRLPKVLRIVKARPRLFTCRVIGFVVFAVLTLTEWRLASRLLVAWDVFVGLYLVLALHCSVNVAQLGATDFPQHFEAAVKFLPIVRIECKAKRQRGSGSI
jgi:hypothetical protein